MQPDLRGGYKKSPSPDFQSGVGYRCIPRFHPGYGTAVTHWRSNGRTRQAISGLRLRSGDAGGRGTDALQHGGFLSENLTTNAYLHHSFYIGNLAHFLKKVNGCQKKTVPTGKKSADGSWLQVHNEKVTYSYIRLHNMTYRERKCNYLTPKCAGTGKIRQNITLRVYIKS